MRTLSLMGRAARIEEVTVRSWAELNEQLFLNAWNPGLRRFRASWAFRGMSCADHDLSTALNRHLRGQAELERDMLRAFRKYAFRDADWKTVWHWLALAQHHGLPTRLLDFTYSPLVALHFATANLAAYHLDGVVWAVDFCASNQLLPGKLRAALDEEGVNVFTAELLESVATTLPAFDSLSKDPFLLFFEPPSLDERIVNQFALFTLMSDPTARLDQWLAQRPQVARRIRIPARLKLEIRDKLDQANITERVLFPGLDGLCRWLRRYYDPHPVAGRHEARACEDPAEQAPGAQTPEETEWLT